MSKYDLVLKQDKNTVMLTLVLRSKKEAEAVFYSIGNDLRTKGETAFSIQGMFTIGGVKILPPPAPVE